MGQRFLFNVSAVLIKTMTHAADSFDSPVRYDKLIEEIALISNEFKLRTMEALTETLARRLIGKLSRMARRSQ